ncbi:MAG: HIT family protein [Magnetococcales bacterium]|nr:HIT family protein [Magnetococcales bacterium]NGZ27700.1 HIT family protein [Magnetococcales bacterium]
MFELHPTLAKDTVLVSRMAACQMLLMNDSTYPWLILVPEVAGLKDLDDVPAHLAAQVWTDMALASRLLRTLFQPDKINVAALGNVVPQLHIHVIARFQKDPVWPQPVWGKLPVVPYERSSLEERLGRLQNQLHSLQNGLPL